ncbi:MAG: helix-turn-helix domain-containing protein [Sphingomonadales bacterium]|nr:helix-turn-helix domain-containing protein [Sphingomonadales bacterium]
MLGFRAHQLLGLLRRHIAETGRGPSYATMSGVLGMRRDHVATAIRRLEARGLVKRIGAGRDRYIGWVRGEDQ